MSSLLALPPCPHPAPSLPGGGGKVLSSGERMLFRHPGAMRLLARMTVLAARASGVQAVLGIEYLSINMCTA